MDRCLGIRTLGWGSKKRQLGKDDVPDLNVSLLLIPHLQLSTKHKRYKLIIIIVIIIINGFSARAELLKEHVTGTKT